MTKSSEPAGSMMASPGLLGRVARAWRRRSPAEFVRLVFSNLALLFSGRYRSKNEAYDLAFDRQFGVQTAGREEPAYLSADATLNHHARPYEPVAPARFHALMAAMPSARWEDYEFVDLGSGKGRALLLASAWPFRGITGVEYSSALHEAAEPNIRAFRNPAQRCRNIRSVCADAATYELPDAPLFVFLFNPFDEALMRRVVANVERSLEARPRPIVIGYVNVEHPGPLDASPLWQRFAQGKAQEMPFAIWSGNGARAP
jgi:SAM-dependent methyltransferase